MAGHYWPTGPSNCIAHGKSCDACQRPIQRKPASELYPIIKPWPFRGSGSSPKKFGPLLDFRFRKSLILSSLYRAVTGFR
ncbi:hypothetical protein CCACVL1_03259 [Corchorus capsularis]|uniref:Uncharacterized protein n=1 Tax=Corchorus capsularis TaxID=210143 RepID=A0A1R3K1E2_COCAP|nr:hypothetical protein CCACVL1_03259 [Corchorus capsularis]